MSHLKRRTTQADTINNNSKRLKITLPSEAPVPTSSSDDSDVVVVDVPILLDPAVDDINIVDGGDDGDEYDYYEILLERRRRRRPFQWLSKQLDCREQNVLLMQVFSKNVVNLSRNTVHLAVYMLDVFMDSHQIDDQRFLLVSLCCLQLAAKIEECEAHVPRMRQLRDFATDQFSASDLLRLEHFVLRFFQYQLLIPTAVTFFDHFVSEAAAIGGNGIADAADYQAAIIGFPMPATTSCCTRAPQCILSAMRQQSRAAGGDDLSLSQMNAALADLAAEYLDVMLHDVRLMQISPSRMAAACLAAARHTACAALPWWSWRLVSLTSYTGEQLLRPVQQLMMARNAASLPVAATTAVVAHPEQVA